MLKEKCLDPCNRSLPDGSFTQDLTCCHHGFGTQSIPSHNWKCSSEDGNLAITFASREIDHFDNVKHDLICKTIGVEIRDDLQWSGNDNRFKSS